MEWIKKCFFRKSYFEGWYMKQQKDNITFIVIAGYHRNKKQQITPFIQLIVNGDSYYLEYPQNALHYNRSKGHMQIGNSLFTENGMKLKIKRKGIQIQGQILFFNRQSAGIDIMGPFAWVPFMQCRHSIMSMRHYLYGSIKVNEKWLDFYGGHGYMEGDRGRRFPKEYIWFQCDDFVHSNCSIMLSVATIPIGKISFWGCIGVICCGNKRLRLATYLGAKIIHYNDRFLWIKQGKYELLVDILPKNGKELKAPDSGDMGRKIEECIHCNISIVLFKNDRIVLKKKSENAVYEYGRSTKG